MAGQPRSGDEPPMMTKDELVELLDHGIAQAAEANLRDAHALL